MECEVLRLKAIVRHKKTCICGTHRHEMAASVLRPVVKDESFH